MSTDAQLKKLERSINIAQTTVYFLIFTIPTTYLIWFFLINDQSLSLNASDWGTFGDFIGGVLNPVIALFAFIWLARSVKLQKEELYETRMSINEAKDAQLEQAKYQLTSATLTAHNTKLSVLQSDIDYCRKRIEFYSSHGHKKMFGMEGKSVDTLTEVTKINGQLATLIDIRSSLEEEISDCISKLDKNGI